MAKKASSEPKKAPAKSAAAKYNRTIRAVCARYQTYIFHVFCILINNACYCSGCISATCRYCFDVSLNTSRTQRFASSYNKNLIRQFSFRLNHFRIQPYANT